MDATTPRQSVATNNADLQGELWLRCMLARFLNFTADPVQTESGGNAKSFNSEPHFLVPQPLDAFATGFEAFDLAGYMDLGSLTGLVHPSESTQSRRVQRHAFMHGFRQEYVS